MKKLSQKNKPQNKLNVKRVVIVTAVGMSLATVLILIFGTGGVVLNSSSSMAAPPPPGNGINTTLPESPKGPGGVGTTDGSSPLKIWYRTDYGMTVNNGQISSWTNAAGVSNHDLVQTAGNKPAVVSNAVNGYDEVSFTSNSHYLKTAVGSLDTSNFVTNEASTFVVSRADTYNQSSSLYTTEPLVGNSRFSNHIPWGGTVYNDIGTCCSQNARLQVGGLQGLTNYNIWSYDANPTTGKQLYRNGTLLQSRPNTTLYHSHATQRFRIGRNYKGDVTEVIVFKNKIKTIERMIVENYLSSKYDIALTTNDLYVHDNGASQFDHDVAGIGQVNSNDNHTDSQGTGLVRIREPQDLDDDEFLFWGNNDASTTINVTNDIPNGTEFRMDRVWKVSEMNTSNSSVDLGNVDMIFDLTGLGAIDTNLIQLIVDSDGDGLFSDETPIGGASNVSGNLYQFENVSELIDGGAYTIGTAPVSSLPIELYSFDANVIDNHVLVEWATISERNNDYFTIERSTNGTDFKEIGNVVGVGNSNQKISYKFRDDNPISGTSYYRLRQTDYDGQTESFEPKAVKYKKKSEAIGVAHVGPNPFTNEFFVDYFVDEFTTVIFTVQSMDGTLVHSERATVNEGANTFKFTEGHRLKPGTFVLILTDTRGNRVSKKLIKR